MPTKRGSASKRKAVKKTASAKGASAARNAAPKRTVKRKTAPGKRKPVAKRAGKKTSALRVVRTVSTTDRPATLGPDAGLHVRVQAGPLEAPGDARRSGVRGLLRPLIPPTGTHPGQTSEQGATHDRPGSQPERVRHLYPNGNRPNSGSARSAQYKGKRRDR